MKNFENYKRKIKLFLNFRYQEIWKEYYYKIDKKDLDFQNDIY